MAYILRAQFVEHGDFGADEDMEGVEGGLIVCSQSRVWRGVVGSSQWFRGDGFVSAMVGWLRVDRVSGGWEECAVEFE